MGGINVNVLKRRWAPVLLCVIAAGLGACSLWEDDTPVDPEYLQQQAREEARRRAQQAETARIERQERERRIAQATTKCSLFPGGERNKCTLTTDWAVTGSGSSPISCRAHTGIAFSEQGGVTSCTPAAPVTVNRAGQRFACSPRGEIHFDGHGRISACLLETKQTIHAGSAKVVCAKGGSIRFGSESIESCILESVSHPFYQPICQTGKKIKFGRDRSVSACTATDSVSLKVLSQAKVQCKGGEPLRLTVNRSKRGRRGPAIGGCILKEIKSLSALERSCEKGQEIEFGPDRSISSCTLAKSISIHTPAGPSVRCKGGEELRMTAQESALSTWISAIDGCTLEDIYVFGFTSKGLCQIGKKIQFGSDRNISSCKSAKSLRIRTATGAEVECKGGGPLRLTVHKSKFGPRTALESCVLEGISYDRIAEGWCQRGKDIRFGPEEIQFGPGQSISSCTAAGITGVSVRTPTGAYVSCERGKPLRLTVRVQKSGRRKLAVESCVLRGGVRSKGGRHCRWGMQVHFGVDGSVQSCEK